MHISLIVFQLKGQKVLLIFISV